jgi:hypothetical protein
LFNGGNDGLEYNPKTNLYKNLKWISFLRYKKGTRFESLLLLC